MKLPGRRTTGNSKGDDAEHQAANYLRRQGLKILDCNYRTRRGEIDIIADDNGTLVFAEVRLRRDHRFGRGLETVDRRKQQRLIRAAEQYLLTGTGGQQPPCRFDVLDLAPETKSRDIENRNQYRVEWLQDAFRPD